MNSQRLVPLTEIQMAKYDQRILKFLAQNAAQAPTITDMMTSLKISIADISESLASLLDQGQITKRMNSHGIECWYPATSQVRPTPPMTASSPMTATSTVQIDTRTFGYLPEIQPDQPKSSSAPVPVQHIQSSDRIKPQTQYAAPSSMAPTPPASSAPLSFNAPYKAAAQGISPLTFAVGLVMAVAFSTWFSTLLTGKEIRQAAKSFVDQKTIANTASAAFQDKTKSNIQALEQQIQTLNVQIATLTAAYSAAEAASPSTTASPAPEKESPSKKTAQTASQAKALKAAKAAKIAKEAKAAKAAQASKATKAAQAAKAAKSAKASKAAAELAKISALRLKKKQAAQVTPKTESYEYDNSGPNAYTSESATTPEATSRSESESNGMPSVPQAPGINDQDLPPPPSE